MGQGCDFKETSSRAREWARAVTSNRPVLGISSKAREWARAVNSNRPVLRIGRGPGI